MTIYTTVAAGASAATINAAIAACPSNQVVQLSAGTYNLTGNIIGKTGVVLRGAGMTSTTLAFNDTGIYGGGIYYGGTYFYQAMRNANYNGGGTTSWTAGYSQGTTVLTVTTTAGMYIGAVLILDQLKDTFYVNTVGYEGDNQAGRSNGARCLEEYHIITATNATTVTITPPVAMPIWASGLSPQVFWIGSGLWLQMAGLENLTVDGSSMSSENDPYQSNIYYESCQNCWVKNVKSLNPIQSHVCFYGGMNNEVRHSVFFGTQNAASLSYGVVGNFAGWCLVEDNAFDKVVGPLLPGSDYSCCVQGYNYTTNMYYSQANNFLMASYQGHDAHDSMLLAEGNFLGSSVNMDFIHGSESHNVLFRNRVTGYEVFTYPSGPSANNLFCLSLDLSNRTCSTVGNTLGYTGIYTHYQNVPNAPDANPTIYVIGMENVNYGLNWGNDPQVYTTLFRHMDYDTVTAGITYNSTNADVTLPDSLYYSSKPSFFGSMPWPVYNPTNGASIVAAGMGAATNIPAGFRYWFGVETPASQPIVTAINGPMTIRGSIRIGP